MFRQLAFHKHSEELAGVQFTHQASAWKVLSQGPWGVSTSEILAAALDQQTTAVSFQGFWWFGRSHLRLCHHR